MKKWITITLVVLMSLSLLSGCGGGSGDEEEGKKGNKDQIVIKYPVLDAEDSIIGQGVLKFKEYVEKESEGTMIVEIYFNGQLGGERQVSESMLMNIVQMSGVGTQMLSTYDPAFAMTNLPYIFKDKQAYYNALDGDLGQLFKKKAREVGFELLGITDSGSRVISNNKREIRTPEDLKNLKMRVPEDEVFINTFEAWGASVTPLNFTEIYTALQQKAVDGQEQTTELLWSMKFMEVQNYLTLSYHMETPVCFIVGKEFYDSLSEEQQEIIKAGAKVENEFVREFLVEKEKEYIQEIIDSGKTVTTLTEEESNAFRELSAPVVDKYVQKYGLSEYYDAIMKYNK